ncbi:hypothetical protein OHB12_02715 [Nocardia sp. NBC_01730]|uniref:hypothetical protein n=1 Tax=Nocardia sp. NBC_01730 TaxID=2975998 RepID=UPI002E0FF20F|nr:hypothetical protein OHB12_02715 [Nocardia sp. NBC_01730]
MEHKEQAGLLKQLITPSTKFYSLFNTAAVLNDGESGKNETVSAVRQDVPVGTAGNQRHGTPRTGSAHRDVRSLFDVRDSDPAHTVTVATFIPKLVVFPGFCPSSTGLHSENQRVTARAISKECKTAAAG